MKTTGKITLSATMAALATVIMLVSYFPYLTYAVPAVAGLFIMISVMEINCKWALLSYISASFFVFLFAEPESKLMFIGFFGFYPILKCLIERINKPVLEWIIKILLFNVCILLIYKVFAKIFMIPEDNLNEFFKYGEIVLLIFANAVFVVFDIALSRMANFYFAKFHFRVSRIFKGN